MIGVSGCNFPNLIHKKILWAKQFLKPIKFDVYEFGKYFFLTNTHAHPFLWVVVECRMMVYTVVVTLTTTTVNKI